MGPLTSRPDHQTWPKLLDAVYEMNSADRHSSFSEAVVDGLSRIVVVFQVLDPEAERIMTHLSPPAPFTDARLTAGERSAIIYTVIEALIHLLTAEISSRDCQPQRIRT